MHWREPLPDFKLINAAEFGALPLPIPAHTLFALALSLSLSLSLAESDGIGPREQAASAKWRTTAV